MGFSFIAPFSQKLEPPRNPGRFRCHRTEKEDKQLCQSIAQTLWDIDPNIHPAHMATCWAIRKYGNGDHYPGKNKDYETIKKWIKEVDPLKNERSEGRPKKIHYSIDLEKGALNIPEPADVS